MSIADTATFLSPTGATLAPTGTTAPGYGGCSGAALTKARISMTELSVGRYVCARTDEGRIVEMRVTDLPVASTPGSDPALTFGFTTYGK